MRWSRARACHIRPGRSGAVSSLLRRERYPAGSGNPLRKRAAQVEAVRWRRYRFFLHGNALPADTDCTGLAAGALFRHGLLRAADLEACGRDLLQAAAPAGTVPGDDAVLIPGVPLVHWEDGAEPGTRQRGRKHDAVACANALYTVQLAGGLAAEAAHFTAASHNYLTDHLASGRYLAGTRCYPSPDAFLYALSRLCARFPASARVLSASLHRALSDREATDSARALAGSPGGALDIALRTLTADNLSRTTGQTERRMLLAQAQQADGSWLACPYYRMGRFPVYFGFSCLTTVFALKALHTRENSGPARPCRLPADAAATPVTRPDLCERQARQVGFGRATGSQQD